MVRTSLALRTESILLGRAALLIATLGVSPVAPSMWFADETIRNGMTLDVKFPAPCSGMDDCAIRHFHRLKRIRGEYFSSHSFRDQQPTLKSGVEVGEFLQVPGSDGQCEFDEWECGSPCHDMSSRPGNSVSLRMAKFPSPHASDAAQISWLEVSRINTSPEREMPIHFP